MANGYSALSVEIKRDAATGRYGTEKLSSILPEVQAGKFN